MAAPPKSSTLRHSASGDACENEARFPQGNLMGCVPSPAREHPSICLGTDPLCDRGATSARGLIFESASFRHELMCSVELPVELRAMHCVVKNQVPMIDHLDHDSVAQ